MSAATAVCKNGRMNILQFRGRFTAYLNSVGKHLIILLVCPVCTGEFLISHSSVDMCKSPFADFAEIRHSLSVPCCYIVPCGLYYRVAIFALEYVVSSKREPYDIIVTHMLDLYIPDIAFQFDSV